MKDSKNKKKKSIYRVILATPTYFVIKNGNKKIKVNKENNYFRGQEILY